MPRIFFRKLQDSLKILILCGLCPLGLSDFKTLATLSAPFSQTHLMHTWSLHHTHFSSADNQENSNQCIIMLTVFSSSKFHVSSEEQEMLQRQESKAVMCYCADQPPVREVNSVARFCCMCCEGEGTRFLFKAHILQQVCKLTSRRGWVLSKW